MKNFYSITLCVLWALNIFQVLVPVKNIRLLNRQKKQCRRLDELHGECESMYGEMQEAEKEHRNARDSYLQKLMELGEIREDVPDEITEEDTPPQPAPVFYYSHKNGEIRLEAAHCDIKWLVAEAAYIIHRLYCNIYAKMPEAAEAFRGLVVEIISGDGSIVWDINKNETQEEADDET